MLSSSDDHGAPHCGGSCTVSVKTCFSFYPAIFCPEPACSHTVPATDLEFLLSILHDNSSRCSIQWLLRELLVAGYLLKWGKVENFAIPQVEVGGFFTGIF